MSVNSVSTSLAPTYGLLSGNAAQPAKSAARVKESPEGSYAKADTSQVASDGDSTDVLFQSNLEQALREGAATAGGSTSGGSSESTGGRPSAGVSLYQRVDQYGNNEPSTSALLKSWNNIMQGGNTADSAAVAFAKALSLNDTPGFESGILDLTA